MNNIKMYSKFCTGCGLCTSVETVDFYIDNRGFSMPRLTENNLQFCKNVCPAGGKQLKRTFSKSIWGEVNYVYLGYSNDKKLREMASSGGAISEIAAYLLKAGIVDFVIHTGKSEGFPWETKTVLSSTKEEVIRNCGSRYSESKPLSDILHLLKEGKKYAFIGKPCDVIALKNYMKMDKALEKKVVFTLSFFCAGVPSRNANQELIKKMGCQPEECKDLTYRGNGWPGYSTVITVTDKVLKISYEDSWGKILGRDIRTGCKFCFDGIGLEADIACCDAWYLTPEKKPDFSEHEGRNAIFARNEKANTILSRMKELGLITISEYENFEEELPFIQAYQKERRSTMLIKATALKLMGQATPNYSILAMGKYLLKTNLRRHKQIFIGTIQRIKKGQI